MDELLAPETLLRRIEVYVEEEVRAKRLPKSSYMVLCEAAFAGEVERGRVSMLTRDEMRAARMVTSALLARGMLRSTSHRAPLRLGLPPMSRSAGFPVFTPEGSNALVWTR